MNLCVLREVLEEMSSARNILVINDHSNDSTENVLVNLSKKYENLEYLNNLFNSGVGNAIKFGLERWEGDIVVICMADSSDSPDDILVSYKKMIEGGYDCIFGSRFIKGSRVINYPIVKLFLNRLFNNLVMLLFRNNYNDSWTQRKSGKSKLNLFKNIRIYLSTLIVCFNDSNKR